MSETEETQLPEVVDQAVETHEKKSPQESFAELRKAKEDLERQKWQAEKELEMLKKQYEMQAQQSQVLKAPPEEEFDFRQLEQEEFPEGKKIAKAFAQVNRKFSEYERKLAEKEKQLQVLETASQYPDFKEVVTAENIEKYIKSDEDNLESVQLSANPLRKIYNLIKKDARYQADIKSKAKIPSQEEQRVKEREGKPVVTGIGVRSEAVSTAAGMSNSRMTREQKNALWAETMAAARK